MNLTEARETADDVVAVIDDLAHEDSLSKEDRLEVLARIANRAAQEGIRLQILHAKEQGLLPNNAPGYR